MQFTDQIGTRISLDNYPKRIVSLVPSQTELLFDLGLSDEVVGITNFCVHPLEEFLQKVRVGGTKSPEISKIRDLKPDLVIANKEENNREDVEAITAFCPVWTSNIGNLDDALRMIEQLASIVGRADVGARMSRTIQSRFDGIKLQPSKSVVYLIWKKPYMAAGNDTFIHHMLEKASWTNLVQENRYPEVSEDQLIKLSPDLVLLSSEPYPFKEKDVRELSSKLPKTRVILVDGELFSWYGSRLVKTPDYINGLNQL